MWGMWWRGGWCVKWESRAAPRALMRKTCGITSSSATAAAVLRTWTGTTCPGLPRALSGSGLFANASSFFVGSARSALRGVLPVNSFVFHHSLFCQDFKEKELMETELAKQEQHASTESKCPFNHKISAPMNRDWWPNQLNLQVLHQHSNLSDPMGEEFDYAKEFKNLDLNAVIKDLHAVMTDS